MLRTLLQSDWNTIMDSDYVFKSNIEKHVIQIFGKEFNKDDDSLILVYYNVYTNKPMMLLQRYNRKGVNVDAPEIDGYSLVVEEGEDSAGEYTEVTYILRALQEALTD